MPDVPASDDPETRCACFSGPPHLPRGTAPCPRAGSPRACPGPLGSARCATGFPGHLPATGIRRRATVALRRLTPTTAPGWGRGSSTGSSRASSVSIVLVPLHAVHQTGDRQRRRSPSLLLGVTITNQGALLFVLIVIIYTTALIGSARGQTVGMMAVRARAVDAITRRAHRLRARAGARRLRVPAVRAAVRAVGRRHGASRCGTHDDRRCTTRSPTRSSIKTPGNHVVASSFLSFDTWEFLRH